ncbi:MAG: hypothetical protein WCA46_04385, partial [Actinocatenispora sp.]
MTYPPQQPGPGWSGQPGPDEPRQHPSFDVQPDEQSAGSGQFYEVPGAGQADPGYSGPGYGPAGPYPAAPRSAQPYSGPPTSGQPYPGQPYPPGQPASGQPYP